MSAGARVARTGRWNCKPGASGVSGPGFDRPGRPPRRTTENRTNAARAGLGTIFHNRDFSRPLLLTALVGALTFTNYAERRRLKADRAEVSAPIEIVRKLFPGASEAVPGFPETRFSIVDSAGGILGEVLCSGAETENIYGYAGPTPVMIGFGPDGRIRGVVLLPNYESTSFVQYLQDLGFFSSWDQMTPGEAMRAPVDAVTGATLTTVAIVQTVRSTLAEANDAPIVAARSGGLRTGWKDALAWGLLLLGLGVYFRVGRLPGFRLPVLTAMVVGLGFLSGKMLSLARGAGWVAHGWGATPLTPAMAMLVLAVALPLVTGRDYYCTTVCPFGALQEIAGRLRPGRPVAIPRILISVLRGVRALALCVGTVLFTAEHSPDFSYFEPFAAFQFRSAAGMAIGLAIAFAVLSAFSPRLWCRTLCPTGYLLDGFRGKRRQVPRGLISFFTFERVMILLLCAILVAQGGRAFLGETPPTEQGVEADGAADPLDTFGPMEGWQ